MWKVGTTSESMDQPADMLVLPVMFQLVLFCDQDLVLVVLFILLLVLSVRPDDKVGVRMVVVDV